MLKILKINIIVTFFIALFSTNATCQSIDSLKLDSLIHVLTLDKREKETVNAYQQLADEYMKVMDYSIALTYADLAFDLATEINYHEGELDAAMTSAHIYLAYYMDFRNSLNYYDDAYKIATEHGFEDELLPIYRGYSTLYASVDNYDLALEFNAKAIEEAEKTGDAQLISDLNAYGGYMYEENGDTSKAIEMYEIVLDIETENNFMHSSKAALTTVAHYYYLTDSIDKSLDLYRSAIVRFERLHDFRWQSFAHAEIANVYLANEQFQRAEKHALKGLGIANEYELYKEKTDNLLVLSQIYRKVGDEKSAQKYQNNYNHLMDSLYVDLSNPEAKITVEEAQLVEKADNYWRGWINTLIILILVVCVVLVSGFAMKTSA